MTWLFWVFVNEVGIKNTQLKNVPCRNKSFGGLTDRQLLLLLFAVSALFLILPFTFIFFIIDITPRLAFTQGQRAQTIHIHQTKG